MTVNGFPSPGDRIGRFRIVNQLGAGGMGVVFSAVEENLGRNVALKVISPQFAHDPEFRERFSREARALAALDSTHVVTVYAHGEEDGFLYIAAQLIPDGDLSQMLQRHGPAPVKEAVKLIEQIASGLADAHEAGLVHRDIKPGNVLIRRKGNTVGGYLGDFGIARRTVDPSVTRVGGNPIGTPAYLAPELHQGAQADARTDIYSLGCLLWVTLSGRAPYNGTSEYEIVNAHISSPVPQIPATDALSTEVNRILQRAMAKHPTQRYQTAADFRDDLVAALRLSAVPSVFPNAGDYQVRTPTPSGGLTPTGAMGGSFGGPSGPGRPVAPTGQGGGFGSSYPTGQTGQTGPQGPGQPGRSRKGLWWGLGGGIAAAAVLAVVLVVTLGGGGGDSEDFANQSAAEITKDAEKDMKVLDSVHVSGSFDNDGTPSTIDFSVSASGDCKGTLSIEGGGSSEVIGADGDFWIKPDEAFWRATSGSLADLVISTVGDKYVAVGEDDKSNYESLCDLDELLESDGDSGDKSQTKEGTGTFDGQEIVKIRANSEDDTETTAYIRTQEPHYLLKTDGGEEGSFTYTDFDEDVDVEAPDASDVAELPNT